VNRARFPVRLQSAAIAFAAALLPMPQPAWAVQPGRGLNAGVWVLLLPVFLALGVALHAVVARAAKAVIAAARPLATGEPEIAGYARRVYHTADPQMLQVIAVALGSGLLLWAAALTTSGWAWLLGVLAVGGAVGLDLLWWHRVAVSGESVWFQRGLQHTVHQVAIENIREVSVDEAEADVLTLRRGRNARVARVVLHLRDGTQAPLPKTDADGGLEEVEEVANQIRARQVHLSGRDALSRAESEAARNAAAAAAASDPTSATAQQREALRKLRQKALAPEAPAAVRRPDTH
jgi:hypothetical protein